ncbi:superantigen-like protein SSL4 [Enemella dayhoffiae]|uniref:hypothetical protein n=1 Tax=Enemella dayhoffiae TaxID=2016507 RepID=UPI00113FD2C4|nr:hypothetical protein [Enemella dayhoffiae]
MAQSSPPPGPPNDSPAPREPLLGLSVPQLAGGALAASTAAAIGSQLGVAGTIVGAGVVSIICAVAGAVYTRTLKHTGARVSGLVRRPAGSASNSNPAPTGSSPWTTAAESPGQTQAPADEQTRVLSIGARAGETGGATEVPATPRRRIRPARLLAAATAVFLLAGLLVTGVETLTGNALSGGGGTTVGRIAEPSTGRTPTPRATPDRSTTPSPQASRSRTAAPEATGSSGPSERPSPRATASQAPTGRASTAPTGTSGGSTSGSGSSGSGSGGAGNTHGDSGSRGESGQ